MSPTVLVRLVRRRDLVWSFVWRSHEMGQHLHTIRRRLVIGVMGKTFLWGGNVCMWARDEIDELCSIDTACASIDRSGISCR
jgi:hypothetical protein